MKSFIALLGLVGLFATVFPVASHARPNVRLSDVSTVYVATTGNDANPCTVEQPCLGFNRAYRVAQPGDTVLVAPGTYAAQTINVDASKTSEDDVVFDGVDPETVKVSGVTVYGKHLEIRNMNTGFLAKPYSEDLTFRNLRGSTGARSFIISAASRINVLNSDFCCRDSADLANIATGSGYANPTDILVERNVFRDQTNISNPGFHTDGLQIGACDRCVIRRNLFTRLYHQQLFMRSWGGGSLVDVLIENNIFLPSDPGGTYEVVLNEGDGSARPSTCGRVWFRNNTFAPSVGFRLSCPETPGIGDVKWRGNIIQWLRASSCTAFIGTYGVDWDYNLVGVLDPENVTCSPNDVLGDPLLTADGHIQAGSAAIDVGTPDGPAVDFDGDARQQGAANDAGADELVTEIPFGTAPTGNDAGADELVTEIPFGTAPTVDDFDRPDARTLGPSWTSPITAFSGSRFHDVLGGTAYAPTSVYQQSWLNTTQYGPNVEAFVTVAAEPAEDGDVTMLYVRLREVGEGTTDGYTIRHVERRVAADTWAIHRVDNGVGTQIASGVGELEAGGKIGADVDGDTIKAMLYSNGEWAEAASAVDGAYAEAGYVGISSVRKAKLDDFAANTN